MPKSVRRQQTRKLRERDISRQPETHTQTHDEADTYTHHIHCALSEAKSRRKSGKRKRQTINYVSAPMLETETAREQETKRERESFFSLVRQSCHRLQYTIVLVCEQASNDEQ